LHGAYAAVFRWPCRFQVTVCAYRAFPGRARGAPVFVSLAEAADLRLLAVYNLPMFSEVYVLFSVRLLQCATAPGPESLEVKLVAPDEIDWASLAFPMVREALRHWLTRDRDQIDLADFLWGPDGGVQVRRHR
jgi:hypothetical protein